MKGLVGWVTVIVTRVVFVGCAVTATLSIPEG
jgi:hypothetical protein